MNAPRAYSVGRSIFDFRVWKWRGAKRRSIHSRYSSNRNSGVPARKLHGPKPSNGESQEPDHARLRANAEMFGDSGATMPQPKTPALTAATGTSGGTSFEDKPEPARFPRLSSDSK